MSSYKNLAKPKIINLPIGTLKKDILVEDSKLSQPIVSEDGTWLPANNVYSISSYPELYSLLGPIGASHFVPVALTVDTSSFFQAMTYGNGLYVYGGRASIDYKFLGTSTDGMTWTEGTPSPGGITNGITAMTYGNGRYLAAADNALITSTNGTTWASANTGNTQVLIYALTYGNGLYVFGGRDGSLRTSTNATTWTLRTSGTTSSIYSLIYGNGRYMYGTVGDTANASFTIGTSTDGITWTTTTIKQYYLLGYANLTYGNGLYVVGTYGMLQTSTNGSSWSNPIFYDSIFAEKSNTSFSYAGQITVAYGDGYYLVNSDVPFTTNFNSVLVTPDFTNWNVLIPQDMDSAGVFYGNGKFFHFGGRLTYSNTANVINATFNYAKYNHNLSTEFYIPEIRGELRFSNTSISNQNIVTYVKAK